MFDGGISVSGHAIILIGGLFFVPALFESIRMTVCILRITGHPYRNATLILFRLAFLRCCGSVDQQCFGIGLEVLADEDHFITHQPTVVGH